MLSLKRRRAWSIFRSPSRMALVTTGAVGLVVTLTPANGAASDIANGVARAVRHLTVPMRNGQAFSGQPAVGALFTRSSGQLGKHFCTASVVDSPAGDLVITAAHCVTGAAGTVEFVPGYDHGSTPYGVWTVTKVYVDRAWRSSASQDDENSLEQPEKVAPRGLRLTGLSRSFAYTFAARSLTILRLRTH